MAWRKREDAVLGRRREEKREFKTKVENAEKKKGGTPRTTQRSGG